LNKLSEIGVYIADTYSPTKFLEQAHDFIENPWV
jgi:hypothetical protein